MTQEKYREINELYKPRHLKQPYKVWRVVGPAGPVQEFTVYGIDEARFAIQGCHDWRVTRESDGKEILL